MFGSRLFHPRNPPELLRAFENEDGGSSYVGQSETADDNAAFLMGLYGFVSMKFGSVGGLHTFYWGEQEF